MNVGIFTSGQYTSPSVGLALAFKQRVEADAGTYGGNTCLITLLQALRIKSIWQKATVVLTANGWKAAKLYAIKATDGSTDFAATGGGGSRVNEANTIVSTPSGTPKVDFTNGCPEVVIERAATNILLNSAILASQTVTTATQSYILSFYGTGTVTVGESTPVVLNGTGANDRVFVTFASTGGSKSITVTGSVKNAQLELMTDALYNFPTSWIPTTGTTVTRSINTLTKTGISSVIDQAKGTIVIKLTRKGAGRIFRMDDGTDSNSIRLFDPYNGGYLEVGYYRGGIGGVTTIVKNMPSTLTIAIRYNTNSCDVYINGETAYSGTNANAATNPYSRFSFSTTLSMISRLKYFAYMPEYATVDDMIKYSTP